MTLLHQMGQALLMAFGMFWEVAWSLVFGFLLSSFIQILVSKKRLQKMLGQDGFKEIALATAFGASSSSCSYASAAISNTLFKKGAALIPTLAFMFASTNLVIELGIVLLILMGWQFMAAEWFGGIVLVGIMTVLVRLTYPKQWVEEARHDQKSSPNNDSSEEMSDEKQDRGLLEKLKKTDTWVQIAQSFVMDWSMLWKDLLLGFLIAGALSVFNASSLEC